MGGDPLRYGTITGRNLAHKKLYVGRKLFYGNFLEFDKLFLDGDLG